jgi:hypothetical protein
MKKQTAWHNQGINQIDLPLFVILISYIRHIACDVDVRDNIQGFN